MSNRKSCFNTHVIFITYLFIINVGHCFRLRSILVWWAVLPLPSLPTTDGPLATPHFRTCAPRGSSRASGGAAPDIRPPERFVLNTLLTHDTDKPIKYVIPATKLMLSRMCA